MNWWERYIEYMQAQVLQISNPLGSAGLLDLFDKVRYSHGHLCWFSVCDSPGKRY